MIDNGHCQGLFMSTRKVIEEMTKECSKEYEDIAQRYRGSILMALRDKAIEGQASTILAQPLHELEFLKAQGFQVRDVSGEDGVIQCQVTWEY